VLLQSPINWYWLRHVPGSPERSIIVVQDALLAAQLALALVATVVGWMVWRARYESASPNHHLLMLRLFLGFGTVLVVSMLAGHREVLGLCMTGRHRVAVLL
jgi:hypothetical protein